MSISILISTIGKDSLIDMLNSLKGQLSENDHLYIIADGSDYHENVKSIISNFIDYVCNLEVIYENDNKGYWGHGIRNKYQGLLKGDYILHADDDDIYIDGSIDIIKKSIIENTGKMLFFKFYHNFSKNEYFWRVPVLMLNNIGTPCGVVPNIPDSMGKWGYRYGGDFDFYKSCKFDIKFIDEYIYVVNPKINGYDKS
jgi:hypothetical protein